MCAFGIIIGDTLPHVIKSLFPSLENSGAKFLVNRQFVIGVCTICISYPLSLYRDIHKLSRASGLALVGMIIIVVSVFIERDNVTPDLKGDPSKRFTFVAPQIAQAIGVISFAFVCHHNSLLIYGSLQTPTLDRFAFVTHVSSAVSLIACFTLAVSAYVVFTNKTQGNVLNNFAPVSAVASHRSIPYVFFIERHSNQCRSILLWNEYVYNPAARTLCLSGGTIPSQSRDIQLSLLPRSLSSTFSRTKRTTSIDTCCLPLPSFSPQ
jgi:hypothetical protein